MYSPFDVPLSDLTLEMLREFLAGADEESLTWEAKGEGPVSQGSSLSSRTVRKAVCGLTNQIGGHVILGATKSDHGWELSGLDGRDEPRLWLDQVLGSLRPVPRYSTRVFELERGRWAAVIEVEPLTQTPCMTSDGQVFERVSSETVQVTDPVRLATLFERGERSRGAAEVLTERTVRTLQSNQLGVRLVLGLAAANYLPDISSRVFHSRYRRTLDDAFDQRLFRDVGVQRRAPRVEDHSIRQSYVQRKHSLGEVQWLARSSWDGPVGIAALLTGSVLKVGGLFDLVLLPAWRLASDLTTAAGGYSDAHLRISVQVQAVASQLGDFYRGLPRLTEVTRWTPLGEPRDDLIGSIQRELQRAAGLWSFEGAPEPPNEIR